MLPDDDPDFRDGVGPAAAPGVVVGVTPPEAEVTVVVFLVVLLLPAVVDMVSVFSVVFISVPAAAMVAPSVDCIFLLVSFPFPVLFSITAVVDAGLEMEILIGIAEFAEDCEDEEEDCLACCFESVVVLGLLVSVVLVLSKRSSAVLEVLVVVTLSLSVVTLNTVSLS